VGVRVLVDGAWGFAASADPSAAEADAVPRCGADRAPARFHPLHAFAARPVRTLETPIETDPFTVAGGQDRLPVEATGWWSAYVKAAQGNMQFWK
jgi:hypothetical protein